MSSAHEDAISSTLGCLDAASFCACARPRLFWTNLPVTGVPPPHVQAASVLEFRMEAPLGAPAPTQNERDSSHYFRHLHTATASGLPTGVSRSLLEASPPLLWGSLPRVQHPGEPSGPRTGPRFPPVSCPGEYLAPARKGLGFLASSRSSSLLDPSTGRSSGPAAPSPS